MPLSTQMPPPGIVRNATSAATPGRWFDSNNIRWRGNVMQPIGGNVMLPASHASDLPRDVLTWHDNRHARWCAFGTDTRLYAYSFDLLALYDITPDGVGPLEHPGAFSGYGLNTYGTGLYGTPRASGELPPGIIGNLGDWWSMDTFGELLLVVPTQDGHLYVWDPNDPETVAQPVANAPFGNRGVVVTDQRHVVLYGAGGDPRAVAWSDQEDMTVWTPTNSNLAGSKLLVTQAVALTALKVSQGILIWTTNDVHLMSYTGPPFAYGITQQGAGCGPISARAPVSSGSFTAWPSWQNFWTWNGNVQPLACDVKDYFFATINPTLGGLTFGSSNPQFAELWWDWPDQSGQACNRYIAINYGSTGSPWLIGWRTRTAGDRLGVLNYPVLGGPHGDGGALYQHEYGHLDDGVGRAVPGEVFAETGAITLDPEGNSRMDVTQVTYDGITDPANPAFGLRFMAKEQPFDTREWDTGLYTRLHNGLMDVRFSGRSVRMRVEGTRDVAWELGRPRLLMTPAGTR